MIAILTAACVFGAIFLFVLALSAGDRTRARTRLERLTGASGGPGAASAPEPQLSVGERVFTPLMRAPVEQLQRALPAKLLSGLQDKLVLAGEPMTLQGFLIFQIISASAFILLPALVVLSGAVKAGPLVFLFMLMLGAVGIVLPHMWLRQRVSARQNLIIKTLPDSFDLITTCVEAGLGLDAALARVSEKVEGPFGLELRRALRDISLGKMRRDALRELGHRTGVPDLITFVNAVIQAEQMGSSLGAVLRVQAEQLRVRRRQRAEEQAYKAPVKMIFPLVLCIFPTLFIVILGPAAITIIQDFPSN
jgi:tight adherence protein C